jgi:hypothetical protein
VHPDVGPITVCHLHLSNLKRAMMTRSGLQARDDASLSDYSLIFALTRGRSGDGLNPAAAPSMEPSFILTTPSPAPFHAESAG